MKQPTPEEIIRLLHATEASSETAAKFCQPQGSPRKRYTAGGTSMAAWTRMRPSGLRASKSRTPSSKSWWSKARCRMKG